MVHVPLTTRSELCQLLFCRGWQRNRKKNIETRAHAAIFVLIKEPFELWRPCFRSRHGLLKLPIVLFVVSQD